MGDIHVKFFVVIAIVQIFEYGHLDWDLVAYFNFWSGPKMQASW